VIRTLVVNGSLCHYAASGGNSLPTFRDNLSVVPIMTLPSPRPTS